MQSSSDPLVWIDLELTGLEDDASILEVFCLVTAPDLTPIGPTGLHLVLHCPAETLAVMNSWCVDTHSRSGLSAACAESRLAESDAGAQLLAYLQRHVPEPHRAVLAGNSVGHDRAALARSPHFRPAVDWLHYRLLDVSSIKEAARRWCAPHVLAGAPVKREVHRAREDIEDSIAEARFYMNVLFRPATVR